MEFRTGLIASFLGVIILLGAETGTAEAAQEDILLGDYIRRKQGDDDRQVNIRIERCGSQYCAVGETYVSKWRATCSLRSDIEFGLHCIMVGDRKDGTDTFEGENYLTLQKGTDHLTYDYFNLVYKQSGEEYSEVFELDRVVRRNTTDLIGNFIAKEALDYKDVKVEIERCGPRYCAHGRTDMTQWLSTCNVNAEFQNRLDCSTVGIRTRDGEIFQGKSKYELLNDANILSTEFVDGNQNSNNKLTRPIYLTKQIVAEHRGGSLRGPSREEAQPEATKKIAEGRYYALLIGVQDYSDPSVKDLDEPIKDARRLKEILQRYYSFDKVELLENPTRAEVFKALEELQENVFQGDSLLLFYAGHGHFDKVHDRGYWLLKDSTPKGRASWFSNGDLQDYIRAIPSKHTLLISDACFSGGIIFKTRDALSGASKDIRNLYKLRSRKAMTSGTLETVPDKSKFMLYLTQRLVENEEPFLPAFSLFSHFREAVLRNSDNVPQYGFINGTGGEGGDFIFRRR